MREIWAHIMRFFGMYAPSESIRIAMYRKAGIRIGKVLKFGGDIWLGTNFRNLINIEDNVLLAGYIQILSQSFLISARPNAPALKSSEREGFFPVIVKKNARIGYHVIILPGVTIGENSVIGAGAVVINDIPPNCIAVGVPAKPVQYFNSAGEISNGYVENNGKMPSNHPLMLYAKCKTCKIELWSTIRCDKQVFRSLDLRDNCHRCPNGHTNRYDQKDYYYKD